MAVTLPSGLRHRTHAAMVRSSPWSHEAARRRAGTSRSSIAIRAWHLISLERLKDYRCRSIARSQWRVVMVSARLSSGSAHDDELRSSIQRLCGFDLPLMLGSPPLGSKGMTGPPQPVQIEAPSLFMRSSRLRSASLLFLARSSIFAGSNLTLEAAPSTDRSVECPEPVPAPAGRAPALDQVPERTVAQISVARKTTALFWRFIERPSKKSLYHILT